MDSIKKVNWCAIFVSWCANEVEYQMITQYPKFLYAQMEKNGIRKNNRWKDKSYVPMTGNIIFLIGNRMGIQIMQVLLKKLKMEKYSLQKVQQMRLEKKVGNLSSVNQLWVWSLRNNSHGYKFYYCHILSYYAFIMI